MCCIPEKQEDIVDIFDTLVWTDADAFWTIGNDLTLKLLEYMYYYHILVTGGLLITSMAIGPYYCKTGPSLPVSLRRCFGLFDTYK